MARLERCSSRGACGAVPFGMENGGVMQVPDRAKLCLQAQAQVVIFVIEKNRFVKAADRIEMRRFMNIAAPFISGT